MFTVDRPLELNGKEVLTFLILFQFLFKVEFGVTALTGGLSRELKKLRYENEFTSFNDIYKLYSGSLSPFSIPNVRILLELCLLKMKI